MSQMMDEENVSMAFSNDRMEEQSFRSFSESVNKRKASTYFRTFSTDISEFSRRRKRFMVGLGEDLTGISESKQIREQYEASSFKSQQSGRSEGRTDFDPELSLRSFRKQEEERIRVQRMDLLLFFVLGVAVSAPFTAILSSLSYFSTTLYGNPKVFLYLNIAVYCPTIVVSTLQGMCDLHYNSRYGHLLAYNFRIVTTFLVSTAVLVVAPTTSGISVTGGKNLGFLILVTLSFGILHQISYGSFYQIASFIPSNGKCLALFSMGYQGAGFVVFFAQRVSNYTYNPTEAELRSFFYIVAAVEIVGLVAYVILNFREDTFLRSMKNQDHLDEIVNENEGSEKQYERIFEDTDLQHKQHGGRKTYAGTVNSSKDAPNTTPLLSSYDDNFQAPLPIILKIIGPQILSLFCTIFGSIFLLTFYAYIESDGTFKKSLPTILFFTKVGFDTMSRPLTIYFQPFRNGNQLMLCSLIRLVFIPFFFMYLAKHLPQNDYCLIVAIAIFSMTSGFFNTNAYQLASKAVEPDEQVRVASIMSFVFTIGLNVALLCATILQETYFSPE